MKRKYVPLSIISLMIALILVLSSCAVNTEKKTSPTSNVITQNSTKASTTTRINTKKTNAHTTTKSESSVPYPLGVTYSWNYDVTITSYRDSLLIGKTTYQVNDTPELKEIYLPGNLFQDGERRVLMVKNGSSPKLLNLSTQRYESLPQGMRGISNQPSVYENFKNKLESQGFSAARVINNSHTLYTKQIGNLRYETVLNTQSGVPESTTIYQEGIPVVNEIFQTQSIKGFNLPKRIIIVQRPINTNLKNNVEIKSIVEYNTKSFETYPLVPHPDASSDKSKGR